MNQGRTGGIELENFVTRRSVERAYGLVKKLRKTSTSMSIPSQGMRAARARDPKLLKALDKGYEILQAVAEEQSGRVRRDSTTSFSERVEPTELGLWKAALETADRGEPDEAFAWIYGAGAIIAGLIH